MTFAELRERSEEMTEVWGYNNTARKPNWPDLVNAAYRDMAWEAECVRGPEITMSTVINQAEYTLPAPDWKAIFDIYHSDGRFLRGTDEAVIRRQDPMWLSRPSGTSTMYWIPRMNVIRLSPTPDSVATLTIYGIRAPARLAADDDVPIFQEYFHEAIPLRAAYRHSMKYAKGEAREVLAARDSEYQEYLGKLKNLQMEDSADNGFRYVYQIEPDRIFL